MLVWLPTSLRLAAIFSTWHLDRLLFRGTLDRKIQKLFLSVTWLFNRYAQILVNRTFSLLALKMELSPSGTCETLNCLFTNKKLTIKPSEGRLNLLFKISNTFLFSIAMQGQWLIAGSMDQHISLHNLQKFQNLVRQETIFDHFIQFLGYNWLRRKSGRMWH